MLTCLLAGLAGLAYVGYLFLTRSLHLLDAREGVLSVVMLVSGGIICGSLTISTTGRLLCCRLPRESGLRGLSIASVICQFGGAVLGFGLWFFSYAGGTWAFDAVLAIDSLIFFGYLGAAVALITGHVLFISCLRGIAGLLHNKELVKTIDEYLWTYFSALFFVILALFACGDAIVPLFAGAVLGLYAYLVQRTRDAIAMAVR